MDSKRSGTGGTVRDAFGFQKTIQRLDDCCFLPRYGLAKDTSVLCRSVLPAASVSIDNLADTKCWY